MQQLEGGVKPPLLHVLFQRGKGDFADGKVVIVGSGAVSIADRIADRVDDMLLQSAIVGCKVDGHFTENEWRRNEMNVSV